ncbi:MAG: hypothetical protein GKR90_06720 [Pseudomonadales bacterium]|nr:hypothetical protein [Pseudomonadales bacterium]
MVNTRNLNFLWLSICIVAGATQAAHAADESQAAIDACTKLVTDYAFYRDRPDADAVAILFTADATMDLFGQKFAGREAIRDRIAAGVGGPVYRHFISTINIEVSANGRSAIGVTYVVVYRGDESELPQTLTEPVAIGEYHDQFQRTRDGWKIAARVFVPVFLPVQP